MEIGEELERIRKGYGIKQNEVGAKSGIAYQSIGKIEKGDIDARFSTIEKLAAALGYEITLINKVDQLEVVGRIAAYMEKYAGPKFGPLTLNKLLGQGGSPRQTAEAFARYLPKGSEARQYYDDFGLFLPHHLTSMQYGNAVLHYYKYRKMLTENG